MSIPSYIDEYFALKNPDAVALFQATWSQTLDEFFAARGVENNQREDHVAQMQADWDRIKQEATNRADKTILEIHGLTVDDIQAMKIEKLRRRAGGATVKPGGAMRPLAFQSFLESEAKGLIYIDAIKAALEATSNGRGDPLVNSRTLRTWLTALIKYKVCGIATASKSKKD